METSENSFHTHGWRQALLRRCKGLPPVPTAVAHPCDVAALLAAVEAAAEALITPILVGPEEKIRATAKAACIDIGGFRIDRHLTATPLLPGL